MAGPHLPDWLRVALSGMNPRRSLGAAAMWLIVALALTFSIAASIWVGSIARQNVLEQHLRRLSLETDQLSTDLSQVLAVRIDAVRGAGAMSRSTLRGAGDLRAIFEELNAAYPHLDWIAAADSQGVVIASNDAPHIGGNVGSNPWLSMGLRGPWLGVVANTHQVRSIASGDFTNLGDLAIPVRDESNRNIGVILTHVGWRRAAQHPERLTDEPDPRTTTEVCVIDHDGLVLVGPANLMGRRWPGVILDGSVRESTRSPAPGDEAPRFERLPNGRRFLVARSALAASDEIAGLGWRVQLSEPNERVFQRANALALRILWVSLCLGVITAVLGILGAKHLTRRLERLAVSVASVGRDATSRVEVPHGADEVARLGRAFATLLDELALERSELERRVAVRTREVERLADESRYAAIGRERLKLARDLHDTLAHSMMAILSEIRFMRKLQTRDPHALVKELARAETIAQEGLQEARNAITQMRVTAVRESGLGPALAEVFERFLNLTGVSGDFQADVAAARFGDERAETILRMAREALRNVERHARATTVAMRLGLSCQGSTDDGLLELRIEDNGVGFDPAAARPGHYGIVGLREQAQIIGAQLDIESKPDRGTIIRVVLRLSPIVFKPMDAVPPS
ncbi:MAG: histidine kinase [Steroidobacteraceae bacterium]